MNGAANEWLSDGGSPRSSGVGVTDVREQTRPQLGAVKSRLIASRHLHHHRHVCLQTWTSAAGVPLGHDGPDGLELFTVTV